MKEAGAARLINATKMKVSIFAGNPATLHDAFTICREIGEFQVKSRECMYPESDRVLSEWDLS
jgi:hypothetical protein